MVNLSQLLLAEEPSSDPRAPRSQEAIKLSSRLLVYFAFQRSKTDTGFLCVVLGPHCFRPAPVTSGQDLE